MSTQPIPSEHDKPSQPTTSTTIPQLLPLTDKLPTEVGEREANGSADDFDSLSLERKKRRKNNSGRHQLSFDSIPTTNNSTNIPDEGQNINTSSIFDINDEVSLTGSTSVPIEPTILDTNFPTATTTPSPPAPLQFISADANEKRVQKLIQQIEAEWDKKQEELKKEPLTVVFSWWDGTGHRMEVTITTGDSILQFLAAAQKLIIQHGFPALSRASPHQLIYVKEDLILPLHYTFYDFIASNSRGKSGSLVHFGVKDDVRLQGNANIERDDAHAGKIMEKSYYESNKHLHPYNRFEPFDPKKSYDKYTIA